MKRTIRKLCWPCFFGQVIVTLAVSLAGLISLFWAGNIILAAICGALGWFISSPSSCMIDRETED
jgi:hypothetical protein